MRMVIAELSHETNTFSPIQTGLGRTNSFHVRRGEAIVEHYKGTNTCVGGFIDACLREGVEIVPTMSATTPPSGTVVGADYLIMRDEIVQGVTKAGAIDGVLLALHGAMVAEGVPDPEGDLIKAVRGVVGPRVPIGVSLDLHANLTEEMAGFADALVGYKSYPHVDMGDVGMRAANITIAAAQGKARPVTRVSLKPMIPPTIKMGTHEPPMGYLVAQASEAEKRPGVLAASVFGGFPMSDVACAGLSAVVVTDGNPALATAVADELSAEAWERRREFDYDIIPLEDAVSRALAARQGPVLLIDHSDNAASGGTQDVMAVTKELLARRVQDAALAAIRDPEAVALAAAAGEGKSITLQLGGKTDMPSIGLRGEPLQITAEVRRITDGYYTCSGPMRHGLRQTMGKTAVLRSGGLDIIVCEQLVEPSDLEILRSVGIEPAEKRLLVLKSRIHYRAAFVPIAKQIIECGGIGVTSSDYSLFTYKNVRRPIYPLDNI